MIRLCSGKAIALGAGGCSFDPRPVRFIQRTLKMVVMAVLLGAQVRVVGLALRLTLCTFPQVVTLVEKEWISKL